ncbi:MAG: hypothetical protein ACRD0H_16805 [Actinomycetes bacterium]
MSARVGSVVTVLAGCLLLAGCDADGDGFDDTTGEPVPTVVSRVDDSSSGGCGPGGWELLCGDDSVAEPVADYVATAQEMSRAAYHEAGHKAVADEYGWSLMSVWIHPDGSGRTNVWAWNWKDPRQRLTLLYAGAVAAGTEEGAVGDYTQAEKLLDRFPDDQRQAEVDAAYTEAEQIVAARATEIERDATVLLAQGRL